MNPDGQALFEDLVGVNGPDAQTEALNESVTLLVAREFEERRVLGAGDVKSCNVGGTNFLYL